MESIVTSGNRNGKVYKVIASEHGSLELWVYNREQDQFVKQDVIFNSMEEIEAYLDSHFGVVS